MKIYPQSVLKPFKLDSSLWISLRCHELDLCLTCRQVVRTLGAVFGTDLLNQPVVCAVERHIDTDDLEWLGAHPGDVALGLLDIPPTFMVGWSFIVTDGLECDLELPPRISQSPCFDGGMERGTGRLEPGTCCVCINTFTLSYGFKLNLSWWINMCTFSEMFC